MRVWTEIGVVASLTAALGCAGVGLGSAVAVLASVATGAGVAWVPARSRA